MIFLQAMEIAFVVLFMGLIITQVFIPLAKETPLFPLLRKMEKRKGDKK